MFSPSHQPALGGAAGGADVATDHGQLIDLTTKIDNSDCYARNESYGFPMTNLFIGDTRLGCKSDADEQLILHVAFQEFVKVSFFGENVKSTPSQSVEQCWRFVSRSMFQRPAKDFEHFLS